MDPLEIIKKVKELLELDKNIIVGIISGFILGIIPAFFIWRHYWRLDLFQRCKQYKSERDESFQESLRLTDELEREQSKNKRFQEENDDLQEKLRLAQRSPPPTHKDTDKDAGISPSKPPPPPLSQKATSLPLVTNRQEIVENVKLFHNYLIGDSTEREFALQSLVYGKCFVVLREGGRTFFAPSKFVGHTNDSREKYEAHLDYLDGRTTNNAINSVLQHVCTIDEDVNREFMSYCEQAGRTVGERQRKYWKIEK